MSFKATYGLSTYATFLSEFFYLDCHCVYYMSLILIYIYICLFTWQVFPDVLSFCKLGMCSTNTFKNTKLETTVQILPLVSGTFRFCVHTYDHICTSSENISCSHIWIQDKLWSQNSLAFSSWYPLFTSFNYLKMTFNKTVHSFVV